MKTRQRNPVRPDVKNNLDAGLWWPTPLTLAQGGRGSGPIWFKAILPYRVCFRTARATEKLCFQKNKQKQK